jgi:acetyltransferase-like isoleucine patch superfamily enzyme
VRAPKFISSSRAYQKFLIDLRKMVVKWAAGESVIWQPGPDLAIIDQPTYAPMRVYSVAGDPPARIGRYCSINPSVVLMTGSEHPLDHVTTFFFHWGMGVGEPEPIASRGPVVIGCDVWMGFDALVLSGVTIGHGAAVAARAVVTKNVAPYEIVGGVPARHIGWRFDQPLRDALLRIAWWEWPVEDVIAHQAQLQSPDVAGFAARHGFPVDGRTRQWCEICDGGRTGRPPRAPVSTGNTGPTINNGQWR